MPSYLAPGVYVEDADSGARPIQAVGTSTAAIFGVAPDAKAAVRTPKGIANFSEYTRIFGKPAQAGDVLTNAVAGFFQNGGGYCYIVNLGGKPKGGLSPADLLLVDALDGISLVLAPGFADAASYEALIGDCERRGDRMAILDTPLEIDALDRLTRAMGDGDALRPRGTERGHAAVYAPWIEIADAALNDRTMQPPSGHLAGLYGRIDAERGVHKAPANERLIGTLGLSRPISAAEQELLNPVGVNCIRRFADGIRVWGARTLADPASEWRYVPVRRLVIMIKKAIELGTRWVVFEPNDQRLWKSIRRDIGAFLDILWRDGALMGEKAEQAYFVKCDAETTTQADIDAGRVVALIGIAPVRPAEFVILRIGQSVDSSTIEEG